MADLLVFAQTLEGLYVRALGGRINRATIARLREIGVDLERPLSPAYTFDVWMKSLALVGAAVFPDKSPEEGRFQLGKAFIEGFRQTTIGRALLRFLRLIGPRKALETAANAFKTGNNYTETRVRDLAPAKVELWMNEVGPYPEFSAGLILAGVEASGARDVRVHCTQHDGHAATYVIEWTK